MRRLLVVALVVSASPAFAQSKVYTNADLGKPLTVERPRPSEDALRSLAAHQFGADDDSPLLIDTSHPYDFAPVAQQAPSSSGDGLPLMWGYGGYPANGYGNGRRNGGNRPGFVARPRPTPSGTRSMRMRQR